MSGWGTTERTRYPGIYRVTRNGTVRYVLSYRVRGLGQRTKTFERLVDAREFQGKTRDPDQVSRLRKLEQGRVALGDYFPLWLDRKRKIAESTRCRYADIGRRYIAPTQLGRMRLRRYHPGRRESREHRRVPRPARARLQPVGL